MSEDYKKATNRIKYDAALSQEISDSRRDAANDVKERKVSRKNKLMNASRTAMAMAGLTVVAAGLNSAANQEMSEQKGFAEAANATSLERNSLGNDGQFVNSFKSGDNVVTLSKDFDSEIQGGPYVSVYKVGENATGNSIIYKDLEPAPQNPIEAIQLQTEYIGDAVAVAAAGQELPPPQPLHE